MNLRWPFPAGELSRDDHPGFARQSFRIEALADAVEGHVLARRG
jgi:hypothetical protein